MVQRRVLQCGLCRSKEKCLKPGLKCVNRWSSSTVHYVHHVHYVRSYVRADVMVKINVKMCGKKRSQTIYSSPQSKVMDEQ